MRTKIIRARKFIYRLLHDECSVFVFFIPKTTDLDFKDDNWHRYYYTDNQKGFIEFCEKRDYFSIVCRREIQRTNDMLDAGRCTFSIYDGDREIDSLTMEFNIEGIEYSVKCNNCGKQIESIMYSSTFSNPDIIFLNRLECPSCETDTELDSKYEEGKLCFGEFGNLDEHELIKFLEIDKIIPKLYYKYKNRQDFTESCEKKVWDTETSNKGSIPWIEKRFDGLIVKRYYYHNQQSDYGYHNNWHVIIPDSGLIFIEHPKIYQLHSSPGGLSVQVDEEIDHSRDIWGGIFKNYFSSKELLCTNYDSIRYKPGIRGFHQDLHSFYKPKVVVPPKHIIDNAFVLSTEPHINENFKPMM